MWLETLIAGLCFTASCRIMRPALLKMAAYERYERRRLERVLIEVEERHYNQLQHERQRRTELEDAIIRLKKSESVSDFRGVMQDLDAALKQLRLTDD